jgi:hypothetical protein
MKIIFCLTVLLGVASAGILPDLSLLNTESSYWADSTGEKWVHPCSACAAPGGRFGGIRGDLKAEPMYLDYLTREPLVADYSSYDCDSLYTKYTRFWWLAVSIPVVMEGVKRSVVLLFPLKDGATADTFHVGK